MVAGEKPLIVSEDSRAFFRYFWKQCEVGEQIVDPGVGICGFPIVRPSIAEGIGGGKIEEGVLPAKPDDIANGGGFSSVIHVAVDEKVGFWRLLKDLVDVFAEVCCFVATDDGFILGHWKFGFQVSADEAESVARVDLDGYVEESSSDGEGLFADQEFAL